MKSYPLFLHFLALVPYAWVVVWMLILRGEGGTFGTGNILFWGVFATIIEVIVQWITWESYK